jgi:penicillin amidase
MQWRRWIARLALLLVIMAGPILDAETPEALLERAKQVLAQLDGDIRTVGLQESVEVLRDTWGVPHIYARNQHDLFFAQGFVTAQDRLFQIDLWRRIGNGETAELFGEQAIEADRFARLMLYRGDMQAEWKSYASDTQTIAASFVSGINAYIDHIGDKLPIEFQILGTRPIKWRPEDILSRMSGIIMTSNWQREIARARLVAILGAEQARLIAPTDPPQAFAPVPGLDLTAITPKIFEGYAAATRPLAPPTIESNDWVIGGALSASGKPLLANDPHRAIALPSLRYLAHLNAPGWNVIGSGEPALPGIAIGHNERIAWGFTIVGTDQSDLYVEETRPGDPRQYRVGDAWQPMQILREKLRVRGRAEPVDIELRFTRHGAVIYQDEGRNIGVALKWVGSEPGSAAYLGSLSVARAQNREEFLDALEAWKSPCENFVYADVDGNIGWVAAALTPIRKGWDGLLPVPGASDRYEWEGFLHTKNLPQSFNPAQGWLATANHNILPKDYPHAITYEWATPHRFLRIQERLRAQQKFTLEDCQSIQHDATSLPAKSLIEVIRAATLPKDLAPYRDLLVKWNGVLSRESQAGPLYAIWLQELTKAFFDDRLPKDSRTDRGDLRNVSVLLSQLAQPDEKIWGSHAAAQRDALVLKTFTAAVERTEQLLGDDSARWSWGRLHTVSFEHPLASLGNAYSAAFNLGPVARPGDVHTPNNTRHDENFRQVHGASFREVFDLADWDRGMATSVPGQSGQPGSEHYADLLPLWAEGKYFPLAFSRKKVEEVTRHTLVLRPRAN